MLSGSGIYSIFKSMGRGGEGKAKLFLKHGTSLLLMTGVTHLKVQDHGCSTLPYCRRGNTDGGKKGLSISDPIKQEVCVKVHPPPLTCMSVMASQTLLVRGPTVLPSLIIVISCAIQSDPTGERAGISLGDCCQ